MVSEQQQSNMVSEVKDIKVYVSLFKSYFGFIGYRMENKEVLFFSVEALLLWIKSGRNIQKVSIF